MSSTWRPEHPQQFYAPGWHEDAKTPVVDGKYYDRATGEVRVADAAEYGGPPAVDIIVSSIHQDTVGCSTRAARPFPVEALLYHIMRVIHDGKLELDSLIATQYAIRVVLSHELTVDGFGDVADEMVNGIWKQEGEQAT
ncbi:hypothetical protein HRG_000845 [Hirsutella rhossiliensis]|uniref:Uncharacterized protein n=1 Tax=Hirsutella rhossiliensis TaxID=111463 RepID=A0A9P8N5V3_9HYPO|nr:uncharacterized protein HRG_00845 [Hirsutella rhossiliensis]KAH0968203.1 hypothetical protein HRG_00845 [Hirsutella rhossiliensis]